MEFVGLLLFVVSLCHSSKAVDLEPRYTNYQFLEQLLERMIRVEIYTKSVEKLMSESMTVINELTNATKRDLSGMNERIGALKQNMETYQNNLTKWKDQTENTFKEHRRDFKANIQTSLDKNAGTAAVAFNVYSITDQSLNYSQPVVFNKVRLNTCGDCYSTTTGIFTAPVGGIYQFNAHLCADKGGALDYQLVVNDMVDIQGEFRAASDSTDTKCTSFSVVSQVNKGHTVSVRGYNHPLKALTNDELSFSGVLVIPQ